MATACTRASQPWEKTSLVDAYDNGMTGTGLAFHTAGRSVNKSKYCIKP